VAQRTEALPASPNDGAPMLIFTMRRRPRGTGQRSANPPLMSADALARHLPRTPRCTGHVGRAFVAVGERLQQIGQLGVAVPFPQARHLVGPARPQGSQTIDSISPRTSDRMSAPSRGMGHVLTKARFRHSSQRRLLLGLPPGRVGRQPRREMHHNLPRICMGLRLPRLGAGEPTRPLR
jgi:hypothetical protein